MRKHTLLCLLISILVLMVSLVLTGCGGVSEDDIKESIDNRKAGETAKLINSYAKQEDKNDLDEALAKDFKDLCKSTEYSDFEFIDKVISKIKDKELKAKLGDIIQNNGSNKVLAFIEGDWVRRDYTNLSGVVINVKSNKNDSVAIITDSKKSKDKDFKTGDVKWKNIKPLSSNEFVFEDLSKGDDSHYEQGYATIDYAKNQINCKISATYNAYKKGNIQVWIKKDVIDEKKETISKKDFSINGEKVRPSNDSAEYIYNAVDVNNKKLRKKVYKIDDGEDYILSRNKVTLGKSDRGEVISAYGYGTVIYASYKKNAIYQTIKDDNTIGSDGFINIIKQAKYKVVYFSKNKRQNLEFYFNSQDKLIGISFGNYKYRIYE